MSKPVAHIYSGDRAINLSKLPADKKKKTWKLIQQENPLLADLLTSDDFRDFKQLLENSFGPVTIVVDPRDIGGTENGSSQRIKESN